MFDFGPRRGVVLELAVDATLAHSPGNQLTVLRSEIEHHDGIDIGRFNLDGGRSGLKIRHWKLLLRESAIDRPQTNALRNSTPSLARHDRSKRNRKFPARLVTRLCSNRELDGL